MEKDHDEKLGHLYNYVPMIYYYRSLWGPSNTSSRCAAPDVGKALYLSTSTVISITTFPLRMRRTLYK